MVTGKRHIQDEGHLDREMTKKNNSEDLVEGKQDSSFCRLVLMSFTWLAFSPSFTPPTLHSPHSPFLSLGWAPPPHTHTQLSSFPLPLPTPLSAPLLSAQHIDFLCVLAWMVCAWSGCLGGLSSGMERKEKSRVRGKKKRKGEREKRVIFNPFDSEQLSRGERGGACQTGWEGSGCASDVCVASGGPERRPLKESLQPARLPFGDRWHPAGTWSARLSDDTKLEQVEEININSSIHALLWESGLVWSWYICLM